MLHIHTYICRGYLLLAGYGVQSVLGVWGMCICSSITGMVWGKMSVRICTYITYS